jgi:hypothetical protein
MDHFEVVVQGELFRISERAQPGGAMNYDFAWLYGPAEGTYGFTVGRSSGRTTAEELVAQARQFVEAFYGPGGIGETDFPNHTPADAERNDRH